MIRTAGYMLITAFAMTALFGAAQEEAPLLAALRVESKPAAAELRIDNQGPFTTPYVTTELNPGTHLITLSKQGYRTHRETVTLSAGERVPVSVELSAVTGLLLIHTEPEGVDVKIDSSNRGSTPLLLTDLAIGQHKMQLSRPGFISKTIDLNITDRAPKRVTETLTPSSATLTIESTPSGAKITLNGASHGTTPATIDEVPEGTTMLELKLDGHKPYSKTLKLAAGQKAQLNAELDPIPAGMRIISIPPKARIYVNNEFKGTAPVNLTNIEPGEYRIRGELPGCEPTARTVTLENGANPTEELRLDSNSGKLEIVTQPAGIKVYIDGQERGTTSFKPDETDKVSNPLLIDLIPEGEREVRLAAKQVYPLTFKVTIKKNQTTILQPRKLKRRFIPDLEIRTKKDVFTGVYLGTGANGEVRLEVRPGIIKKIPKDEIKVRRPLQAPTLEK